MRLFDFTVIRLAARYVRGSRKRRFASFVGIFACAGIALGVCALIVVSSVMQGLQDRLKEGILNDTDHITVKASSSDILYLLDIPHVVAVVPFVKGEAMLQYQDHIMIVTLCGMDYNRLYLDQAYAERLGMVSGGRRTLKVPGGSQSVSDEGSEEERWISGSGVVRQGRDAADHKAADPIGILDSKRLQFVIKVPPHGDVLGYRYGSVFNLPEGTFSLAMNASTMADLGISPLSNTDKRVRLISTLNARYTPLGFFPVMRRFTVTDSSANIDNSAIPAVFSNYKDVRAFFRIPENEQYFRLYLEDPFLLEDVKYYLDGRFEYSDWTERFGDFFKAVGLEKITMSVMLCLIILVASFNILSSLTMVVSTGLREIAVLKTLGMSRGGVVAVFFIVGMSSSLLGTLIGVASGIPLALHAQEILAFAGVSIVHGKLPVSIDPFNIMLTVIFCLSVSAVSTLYPAWCAGKTDPVKNLSYK